MAGKSRLTTNTFTLHTAHPLQVFTMWAYAAASLLGSLSGLFSAAFAAAYAYAIKQGKAPDASTLLRAVIHPQCHFPTSEQRIVALVCALLLAVCYVWILGRHGWSGHTLALIFQVFLLCSLALIDIRTGLLPDALNLPLFFTGLFAALQPWAAISLTHALLGAFVGYGFLWLVTTLFSKIAKKEGMGRGDLKLAAALGACCGIDHILYVLLLASLAGTLFAIVHQRTVFAQGSYPFGPFLAGSGLFITLVHV
ncbi:prepilin peptidase [Allopusillimonas ginsengisoli]|nr:prepilin peptidase [Allopusillimonas ginsengisoli]